MENRLKIGIDIEILRRKFFLSIPKSKFEKLIEKLQKDEIIYKKGSKILSPVISYELSGRYRENYLLAKNSIIDGKFSPPDVKQLAKNLSTSVEEISQLLSILEDKKEIVKVKEGIFFDVKSFEEAKIKLMETINKEGKITLAKFRDILRTSRKYSEALLNFFDKEGLTVRIEDYRILKKGK